LLACFVLNSAIVDAENEPPPANSVQITFEGEFHQEPVEIRAAGKKTTAVLDSGYATPAISKPINVYIGGLAGTLAVRLPRLKLAKSAEINLRKGQYIYVEVEKNSVSVEQSLKERLFE